MNHFDHNGLRIHDGGPDRADGAPSDGWLAATPDLPQANAASYGGDAPVCEPSDRIALYDRACQHMHILAANDGVRYVRSAIEYGIRLLRAVDDRTRLESVYRELLDSMAYLPTQYVLRFEDGSYVSDESLIGQTSNLDDAARYSVEDDANQAIAMLSFCGQSPMPVLVDVETGDVVREVRK